MRHSPRKLLRNLISFATLAGCSCGLTGCMSGFGWFQRSKPDTMFAGSADPFLDDEPVSLIAENRPEPPDVIADEAEPPETADAGSFNAAGDWNSEIGSSNSSAGASLADFEPGDSSDRPIQLIGGEEAQRFENSLANDDSSPGGLGTADFESDRVENRNTGLGAIDPWGSERSRQPPPEPGVGLSFEESDNPAAGGVVGEFELDAEEWNPNSTSPEPSEPSFDDFDDLDTSTEDRSGISIIEAPIEQLERSASAIPEAFENLERKVREERDSIRGRFSRLGARFGLGGDEVEAPDTPTPEGSVSAAKPGDCIEELIARTQTRLDGRAYAELDERERQQYLRDHVNLRLFYLVNEQSERALDAIPGIPPAEQEFWQQMFWSLVQYRDVEANPDSTDRATQTAIQLRAALQRLQESAKLQIRNASFCRRINGFGSYDRFERDAFKPGQPVLVYAEIDNFKTEPTTAGQHRTLLRSTLRIFPENGSEKPVDSVTLRAVEDVCRSPRRDYFNSYEFTIPNDIAPGRYLLEITIDDQLAKKAARQTVLFSVK